MQGIIYYYNYTTCDNWKLYYYKIPLAMHGEVNSM